MNLLPKEAIAMLDSWKRAGDQAQILIASAQEILTNINEIVLILKQTSEDVLLSIKTRVK